MRERETFVGEVRCVYAQPTLPRRGTVAMLIVVEGERKSRTMHIMDPPEDVSVMKVLVGMEVSVQEDYLFIGGKAWAHRTAIDECYLRGV